METRTPPIHGDRLRLGNDNEAKMAGKEKFYAPARSESALQKRSQQLQAWERSETNKQPSHILDSRKTPRVKFGDSVVFMAAAQSGDVEEVERLVQEEGADVNCVNKDGLTALHQCCIDDDFEMVKILVRLGADVDIVDYEGWTPLHAASSCEHEHIVRLLLDSGAFPCPINNEGDSPLDLVEEGNIEDMIKEAVENQGIDAEEMKSVEERVMLEDANRLKNNPNTQPIISPGSATPLHIASSKDYLSVMKVLLSMKGVHCDPRDDDGWTPLHAAIYWGNMEAAEMLVAYGGDLTATTKAGESMEDLCDPKLVDALDDLKKLKEEHNNRQRRNAVIHHSRGRPSLSHMNSKEDLYKDKASPVVRRRSSKERSLFPKQDMLKERAERENWATDSTESNSIRLTGEGEKAGKGNPDGIVVKVIDNNEVNASGSRATVPAEEEADTNNAKEAFNSANDLESEVQGTEDDHQATVSLVTDSSPITSPQESPQHSPQTVRSQSGSPKGSPKLSKKRPNMSSLMMKRVGLWESQVTITPSPRTSTPLSSPQVETAPGATAGEVKRFPFQPKTITPHGLPERSRSDVNRQTPVRPVVNLAPRTPSFDEGNKRSSFDEARFQGSMKPLEEIANKASSLPRGAKIGTETPSTPASDKVVAPPEGAVSSEATPTPATGETSWSNVSDASPTISRSLSQEVSEGSETRRHARARRTRESRKQTQPVSAEDIELALRKERAAENADARKKSNPRSEDRGSKEAKEEEEEEEKEAVEVPRRPVVQSAYRPLVRPTPRLPKVEVTPEKSSGETPWSRWESRHKDESKAEETPATATAASREPPSGVEDGEPKSKLVSEAVSVEDDVDSCVVVSKVQVVVPSPDSSTAEASSSTMQERRRSNARRRPRHSRRSTGLTYEADPDEDIPENLECFVKRKETNEDAGNASEDYPDTSSESGSLSVDGEVSRLKQLLDEVQSRRHELETECNRLRTELEQHQRMVLEVNRKYEDVSRAHEQEKREREEKEARIAELEAEAKSIHDVKKENQRLKDENSALIRVIGKLSRTPLHTHT